MVSSEDCEDIAAAAAAADEEEGKNVSQYRINNIGGRKGKLSYADENAIIISYYR